MNDDWTRLQSYQQLQNKLFSQLGPTDFGADDTVQSCRLMMEMEAEARPKFILERWGILTDEVNFLLNQIDRLEKVIEKSQEQ